MRVGDIIIHSDERFERPHFWRIDGVYLGCEGQESLIEIRNLLDKPGVPGRTGGKVYVPEPLVRGLPIYRRVSPSEL